MRNAIITKTGADKGKSLEAIVFHHLRQRYRKVFYWRGQGEVDFVVLDGTSPVPYQATWGTVQPRHIAAVEEFYSQFPHAKDGVFIDRSTVEQFLAQ